MQSTGGDIDLNVDGSDTVGDTDDENKGYEPNVELILNHRHPRST